MNSNCNQQTALEQKVNSYLDKMSVEEMVAQLQCYLSYLDDNYIDNNGKIIDGSEEFDIKIDEERKQYGLGHTGVTANKLSARKAAQKNNKIQKVIMENSRLGIPILIHDEAIAGIKQVGATCFPQPLAQAGTWNVELMKKVYEAIALETKSRGVRQVLSPVVNIVLDPRWGRTHETFGEEPYLASKFGVAFCKAFEEMGVITTPKHFVANHGDAGQNSGAVFCSEWFLREYYLPPFKACIKEGKASSIMPAYNTINGVPCAASTWLLRNLLREEWGFDGFVVSDYSSLRHLIDLYKIAKNEKEAAKRFLEAGVEVDFPNSEVYGSTLIEAVKDGEIDISLLKESVRAVLRAKFNIGLFDNPFADPDYAERVNDSMEHRKLALEASLESIVLLKNENGILPLNKNNITSIAVLGPLGNRIELGNYTGSNEKLVSVYEALKEILPGADIMLEKGVEYEFPDKKLSREEQEKMVSTIEEGITKAVNAAILCDVSIVVVGAEDGEARDRASLDLPAAQEELIRRVCALKKPAIIVLQSGNVITMQNWHEHAPAIIEAWYPGEEGGNAIAKVIFGDFNPSGKLPITFPLSTAQVPNPFYAYPDGSGFKRRCVNLTSEPLFPFGFGLSYTTFEYSNLRIEKTRLSQNDILKIQLDIKNTGERSGHEVVQLYVKDCYASISRPYMELKGFIKVFLSAKEKKTIEFNVPIQDIGFHNEKMEWVVEPGEFIAMLGSSSEDIRLSASFEVEGN